MVKFLTRLKTKKTFIIIVFIIVLIFIYFYNNITNNELKTRNKQLSYLNEFDTYVAIGVLDDNVNLIDDGNTINMSNNNTVHHTIDLMQKIDENRDYLLIAMIDFELSPIKINGKMHNSYLFSTEKVDQIALDIEIEIPKNSKELTYIVIKNPNFMPENFDVGEIISLQTVLSKRFNLENSDENIKYESNFTSSSKGPIDNLWISSNKFEQQSIYRGKSGDKVYITLGNYSKENLDYAVVMFSDWNQVAFNNGSNVKYFNLNPNEKQIFELTLPDINESSLFQVIAFPMPYKITSPTSYDGSLAYGSFKFILEP